MTAERPKPRSLAVVTGASAGIGAEFARQLAARGHDLLLVARRRERLQALAAELEAGHRISVHILAMDLADLDAAERLRAEVERIGLPLKWLINNAGYGLLGPFEKFSVEDYRRFVRVMGLAPVEFVHALLPQLRRAEPAHVVNVASLAALMPGVPGNNLYPGVKSMLIKFTETMALELELTGAKISMTVSCPGMTESEIFEHHSPDVDVSYFKSMKFMPASLVVRQALCAAEAGRVTVIPGLANRITAFVCRWLPRSLLRGVAMYYGRAIIGKVA